MWWQLWQQHYYACASRFFLSTRLTRSRTHTPMHVCVCVNVHASLHLWIRKKESLLAKPCKQQSRTATAAGAAIAITIHNASATKMNEMKSFFLSQSVLTCVTERVRESVSCSEKSPWIALLCAHCWNANFPSDKCISHFGPDSIGGERLNASDMTIFMPPSNW